MKNIILVEDRINRQKLFIERIEGNALSATNLKNVAGKEDFEFIAKQIADKKLDVFDAYDAIVVHRSAFDQGDRQALIGYCADNHKPLVLFSGGISAPVYSESQGFPFLSLNSKDLYSDNLKAFLDKAAIGEVNLMLLAFGQNWEINALVKYELHLTSLFYDPELETKIPKVVFDEKLKMPESIKNQLKSEGGSFSWNEQKMIETPKEHLKMLLQSLTTLISTKITFQ